MSYSAYTLLFANNAGSTFAGPITNTATSLNLASGGGALFPNPSAGQAFVITAVDAATGLLREIMLCTSRSTDTLTVVRAQEGTTALNWLAGDLIQQLWTAGQAADFLQLNSTQAYLWAGTFSGSANALTATIVGAPATLTHGLTVIGELAFTNTAATTFNLNSLGAVACYRTDDVAFAGGEVVASGLAVFVYDGAHWVMTSALPRSFILQTTVNTYLASGSPHTWVVPAGIYSIDSQVWSAGGGSGSCTTTGGASSGGGGGGYSQGSFTVTPGDTITITVGTHGLGGGSGASNAGTAGGNSSVVSALLGTLNSATGGGGGNGSPGGVELTGGTAGAGSGGTFNLIGGQGGPSWEISGSLYVGGTGGPNYGSSLALGGPAGSVGAYPGGGGAGTNQNAAGNIGADGLVIITY